MMHSAVPVSTALSKRLCKLVLTAMSIFIAGLIACNGSLAHAESTSKAQQIEDARYKALAQELRCLVCQNQSIADSAADLALDLKREIREQIQTGKTDAEISTYMVERYGDFVLYRPPFKWLTGVLWAAPLLLLAFAVWALRRQIVRKKNAPLNDFAATSALNTINVLSSVEGQSQPIAAKPELSPDLTQSLAIPASASISRSTYLLGFFALLVAVGIYALLGTPQTANTAAEQAASNSNTDAPAAGAAPAVDGAQIQAMVARLAERLKNNPDDAPGWFRLARAYAVLERYKDAAQAFAQAEQRAPAQLKQDPQALLDYAKSLAISGTGYQGKAAALVAQALQVAPNEPNVLLIAGLAAAQQGRREEAKKHWQTLLPMIPPGHELEALIKNALDKLERGS
jgi:cytochrome c-type biogenesis protein CcmH